MRMRLAADTKFIEPCLPSQEAGMAPPLPHAGGARPSLVRGGLSSTHRRGEGAAPGKLAAASEPNGHTSETISLLGSALAAPAL